MSDNIIIKLPSTCYKHNEIYLDKCKFCEIEAKAKLDRDEHWIKKIHEQVVKIYIDFWDDKQVSQKQLNKLNSLINKYFPEIKEQTLKELKEGGGNGSNTG